MTPAERTRDLLRRYHRDLGAAVTHDGIATVALAFKNLITDDIAAPVKRIFDAHHERVAGRSSPSETDAIAREVIG